MVICRKPKGKVASCFLAGLVLTLSISSGGSLDPREVTNGEYLKFVRATGHPRPEYWHQGGFPEGAENEPVVLVSWHDAVQYCQWAGGKRLPQVEEWMAACEAGELGKAGDVWEWTSTEVSGGANEPGGFKALCGPGGTCDCSHRYRPDWKNGVKGFRCMGGNAQVTSIGDSPGRRQALSDLSGL
ncbi:MAG TPA: SUMF1/EgtB/PvdO family nonheme iron enzyme [Candidatus Binatia bacterium]